MATVHLVDMRDRWAPKTDLQDRGKTGFGEWLRRAREARGLTLDDITRETKIPLRNLVALEHGDFGLVPEFYQRAEVRAIARAVGVDEGLAIGRLDSAIAPVEPQPKPGVPRPDLKLTLSAVLGALALGVLLLTASETGRAMLGWTSEPGRTPATPSQATLSKTTGSEGSRSQATPPAVRLSPAAPAAPAPEPAPSASPRSSAEVVPAVASSDVATAEATALVETPPGSVTELVVRTEPSGAHVTVNGIGWGVSPVTIRHLPPGPKHIRATKEGFTATEQVLALGDGQRQALNLRLGTTP